jgi:hypothetical protein
VIIDSDIDNGVRDRMIVRVIIDDIDDDVVGVTRDDDEYQR